MFSPFSRFKIALNTFQSILSMVSSLYLYIVKIGYFLKKGRPTLYHSDENPFFSIPLLLTLLEKGLERKNHQF